MPLDQAGGRSGCLAAAGQGLLYWRPPAPRPAAQALPCPLLQTPAPPRRSTPRIGRPRLLRDRRLRRVRSTG
eukprot:scaffold3256_cov444-Prasinococcus_capsulatus_cf.AAC.8